jgi:WD40 repeat protein
VFSRDGTKLASGSSDRLVQVWDIATQKVERTFIGHLRPVNSVVFSPDGSKLASGSDDRTVRVWDVQVEHTFKSHLDSVSSVAFSYDGSQLASGSNDCTVLVWDVATGQVKHKLDHPDSGLGELCCLFI